MDILETIQAHAAAMRLPLYAVTLSAVAKADTPLMLILHWHGFGRQTATRLEGLRMPVRPVAGSALQINTGWNRVETLDEAMLAAAWRLGAWDLERANHRPWWRLNAGLGETMACHRAFASYPGEPADRHMVVEAPDQDLMVELAGVTGYIRWQFHPRATGIWARLDEDDATLEADGTRRSLCPLAPAPYDKHRTGRNVYRLGRGAGILKK